MNRSFGLNTIESVLIDKNNTVWLGTREGVVLGYESKVMGNSKYNFSLLQNELPENSDIIDPAIHDICEDPNGRIWIGTENGLSIYDPGTRKITIYRNDPFDRTQ